MNNDDIQEKYVKIIETVMPQIEEILHKNVSGLPIGIAFAAYSQLCSFTLSRVFDILDITDPYHSKKRRRGIVDSIFEKADNFREFSKLKTKEQASNDTR